MRLNVLATVLIGMSVLSCVSSCGSTKGISRDTVTAHETFSTTDKTDVTDRRDSVVVVERDTVREVTVVTVRLNEAGDTLRCDVVTDREKIRDANKLRVQDSRTMVKTDTVIVEKQDSVAVERHTNLINDTNKRPTALSYLKWIFGIIIGLIGLVVTVNVCLLRR